MALSGRGFNRDLPSGNIRVINRMNSGKPKSGKADRAILSEALSALRERAETTGELLES